MRTALFAAASLAAIGCGPDTDWDIQSQITGEFATGADGTLPASVIVGGVLLIDDTLIEAMEAPANAPYSSSILVLQYNVDSPTTVELTQQGLLGSLSLDGNDAFTATDLQPCLEDDDPVCQLTLWMSIAGTEATGTWGITASLSGYGESTGDFGFVIEETTTGTSTTTSTGT